jgi:UDP-N-acetylmuramoylalanine--D-glutamate ligase
MMAAATKLHKSEQPLLVVGLGLTGWSVVRHLYSRGESLIVTDTRKSPPFLEQMRDQYPDIPFVVDLPIDDYKSYREVVASPGLAVMADFAIGDIELFAREVRAPVIGITGSNGKSTVTTLVGEMLKTGGYSVLVGGNIGTPALDLLELPIPDFYVLELSSFQLETTASLSPCAAVVLNISEDHMDRYRDVNEYAKAKLRIYDHATCKVFNRNDTIAGRSLEASEGISFGLDPGASGDYGVVVESDQGYLARGHEKLAPISDLVLQGRQNVANVLAAMALIECSGIELNQMMIEAALHFKGLPHRCELVGIWEGVRWINDSKGTNVGATLAAINGVDGPVVLIAGGQGKGADFSALEAAIERSVKAAVLIGEDAAEIEAAISGQTEVAIADSLKQAVELAAAHTSPGDTVLFSPACASFDMFESYEHRGNRFRELVIERHHAH